MKNFTLKSAIILLSLSLAFIFKNNLSAQDWNEIIKQAASDGSISDQFGYSVSISGSYAIVGAIDEDEDADGNNTLSNAGSAYIFYKSQGDTNRWGQVAKIVASDRNVDDRFGISVSISGDYIVVGAYWEDEDATGSNTMSGSGSAYIFYKDQGGINKWGQVAKIVANDRAANDRFGGSVSISGDYVVVGSYYEDEDADNNNTMDDAGSAYIFYKDQGGINKWGQVAKIVASDRDVSDYFGISVSISGDYAVVGAHFEDEDAAGGNNLSNSGSAYIFYKDQDGTNSWGQVAKIVASNRYHYDFFGYSVSISGDYAVVGAYFEDEDADGNNTMDDAGSAYIFYKDQGGTNKWGQVAKIVASDRATGDYFGYSVSISGDYVAVGAYIEDEDTDGNNTMDDAGSAYIFYKDQGGINKWGQVAKIVASDRNVDDRFGGSVSISVDYCVVGAYKKNSYTGMSYIFQNVLQASNLIFSNHQHNQFSIDWTIGDGTKRAVFMKQGNSGTANPSYNTTYTASATFGSGTEIGSTGWYCIYNGTGDNVTVTGLNESTEYRVMVCEYYGSPGSESYIKSITSGNPSNQWTIANFSVVTIDVSMNRIISTTSSMECSMNSTNGTDGNWYNCSNSYTPVSFNVGDVYVRDLHNPLYYHLVATIDAPAAAPIFSYDYFSELTVESIPTTIEYNYDNNFSTTNMSGTGIAIAVTPGMDIFFRTKATPSAFPSEVQTLVVPDRPATPSFTIDYIAETTSESIPSTVEYNTDNIFSTTNTDGAGDVIPVTPGTDIFFRIKATGSNFVSTVYALLVPDRPTELSYSIDYFNETTAENIASTDDYSMNPDMSDATSGSGAKIVVTPGTDLYLRNKATTSSFSGDIQHLVVPDRPVATSYSIDFYAETTTEKIVTTDEYSTASDMSGATDGTNDKLVLTPGTDLYFRTKASISNFDGDVQHLIVPDRPGITSFSIGFIDEITVEVIPTTVEYNTDNIFITANIDGTGSAISLSPGTDLYFRVKASDTNFVSVDVQTLVVPVRPATPTFTIDYISETTVESVASTVEYNTDNNFSTTNTDGTGELLSIIPGTDMYFRVKVSGSNFISEVQTLDVPDRPPQPNYTIDYFSEETTETISSADEYSENPEMSDAVQGIFQQVPLTPGTDIYVRVKATSSAFSGEIQHIVVPARSVTPVVSLSDRNSATARFKKSSDGTGSDVSTADGYEYSMDHGTNWSTILDITTVNATGPKTIIVRKKATTSSFKSLSTGNLDEEEPVATITATTGCNGPNDYANIRSNIDTGIVYLILEGEQQITKTDFNAAVISNKGSKLTFLGANIDLVVPTAGLIAGNYYAYIVNILDSISEKSSSSVTIFDIPTVSLGTDITKCDITEVTLDPGTEYTSYLWSYNDATTQTIKVIDENDYIVTVTDDHECKNSDTISVRYNIPYQAEKICLVTVDLATGKNIVVWEKTHDVGVFAYNIYRETIIGQYENIGTVGVTDLSIFLDETAEPESQSYLYKITAVDTCGNESELANSQYHRPSFLQYVSSEGGINLEWTDYNIQGVADIGEYLSSYVILRGNDSTGLVEYKTVGSINNFTDTDPDALVHRYYYRVAGILKDPCYPTAGKKADSGPYSHSMSNIEDNRLQAPVENQAPTDLTLNNLSIDENLPAQTLIGRFSTVDPDVGDSHTYAFVSGAGDSDNSSFEISGDSLLTAEIFDYETKSNYSIRVSTTDTGSLSFEKQFTILINDVSEEEANQSPTDISIDNNNINENEPVGSLVGKLTTTDPDAGDTHSYILVTGTGSDGNSNFSISSDSLLTAAIFDFEVKSSYSIRVKTTDSGLGNLSFEKTFTINVNDMVESGMINKYNQNLTIYPNPFKEAAIIEFNNPKGNSYTLYLTDISGKVCRIVDNITTSRYVLEREALKEGFYFIELRGPKIYRGKIVIE